MKNLISLLGGDKDADDTKSSPTDSFGNDDDTDGAPANEGFDAAADELFSAVETKDVDAFTSALKTCIEMYK